MSSTNGLPADAELELALLGNVSQSPDWLDNEALADELFHVHRSAWERLRARHVRGEAVDFAGLSAVFFESGKSGALAADAYERARETVVQALLPVLADLARQRELLRLGQAFTRAATANGTEAAEALEELAERVEKLRHGRNLRQDVVESRAALGTYLDELAVRRQSSESAAHGLPWGIPGLDAATGGIQRGEVTVLAARPSVGKSALAHQAVRASAMQGNVLLVTPEMSRREVLARMIAQNVGIAVNDQRKALIGEERWNDLLVWAPGLPSFVLYDATQPPCADIAQLVARRAGGRNPVQLVILDHLGWTDDRRRPNEPTHELRGRQMRMLKAMGRRYDCGVLVLCQLNRMSEDSGKMKMPSLGELRASGAIEEDADVVILLHRETRTAASGTAIIAKQRNGPCGNVPLRWDGSGTRWLDGDANA